MSGMFDKNSDHITEIKKIKNIQTKARSLFFTVLHISNDPSFPGQHNLVVSVDGILRRRASDEPL